MLRLLTTVMMTCVATGAVWAGDLTRMLAQDTASNLEAAQNQTNDNLDSDLAAALKPFACQTLASGDHVISNVKLVGDGTNDCLVISGTANVVIEDSEIVHVEPACASLVVVG